MGHFSEVSSTGSHIFVLLLGIVIHFNPGFCEQGNDLTIDGDIILGGLFPIHKKSQLTENKCGVFNENPGYQYMEAMLFAIHKINKDPKLLPNITLGAQIYDTCQSKTIAADHAKEFIKMTLFKDRGQLAGVVGALSSGVSETVASFLRVFEIPQISYSSTSVTLSNKDIYSYFLRTVAPDSFQALALVDVIHHLGWTYVSAINSAGTYGDKGMEIFLSRAKERGICIDFKEVLPAFPNELDYQNVINRLVTRATQSNVTVIVLFCTQTDARNLLEAAANKTQGASRFTWVGSDGWSNRVDVTLTSPETARGALTMMPRRGNISDEFKKYFTGLTWNNNTKTYKSFFKDFWYSRFHCHPPGMDFSNDKNVNVSCHDNVNLKNVTIEFSPVRVVINAVYAFAHALHALQKELCQNQIGLCAEMKNFRRSRLLEYLKNVSFHDWTLNTTVKFDKNGEVSAMYDIMNFQKIDEQYKYVNIGDWNGNLVRNEIQKQMNIKVHSIKWNKGSSTVPRSFCSSNCPLGAIRAIRPEFDSTCCWVCKTCGKLQIILNNTCLDGPAGWIPDKNRTSWTKRQVVYPKWNDIGTIFLVLISLLCLTLTIFTIIVYVTHTSHRIVKASGRELCYIMLIGIGLCFIVPFLFIAKPNDPLCYTRNLVTGIALAMCYAPLFMKINRIYRIFTSAKSSVARPSLVTPRVQVLVTIALIMIQLMFTTLWFIAKPLNAVEKYYSEREKLVLECKVDQLSYSVNLCYVIVLMILSTIYAFKTRHFPKNFNESKYIGITMYITCAIWIAFFPFYMNSDNSFTHVYLISGACVTVGLVTLIGLFAQKVYIIYCIHDIRSEDLVMTSSQKHPNTKKTDV